MKDTQSSRTADDVARLRAVHQLFDSPRIFDDPVAVRIVGEKALAEFQARSSDPIRRRYLGALRAAIVVRSRYAEDELERAIDHGIHQYVVLGAGLDTFAYRQPRTGLRLFEVDHPATQAWKMERLKEAGISVPKNLTFAPINFETQTLADVLARASFDFTLPAFFSWLGVTPYLTRDAIFATLGFIATSTAEGSTVVFDYMIPRHHLSAERNAAFATMAERVKQLGEPWQPPLDSTTLLSELHQLGFRDLEDLGAEQLNERYFRGRDDGLKLAGGSRLLRAIV